jgi:hypothetical protein
MFLQFEQVTVCKYPESSWSCHNFVRKSAFILNPELYIRRLRTILLNFFALFLTFAILNQCLSHIRDVFLIGVKNSAFLSIYLFIYYLRLDCTLDGGNGVQLSFNPSNCHPCVGTDTVSLGLTSLDSRLRGNDDT